MLQEKKEKKVYWQIFCDCCHRGTLLVDSTEIDKKAYKGQSKTR